MFVPPHQKCGWLTKENDTDHLMSTAFWSIYKFILLLNNKGHDFRKQTLKYVFRKRVEINCWKNNPLYNLPRQTETF